MTLDLDQLCEVMHDAYEAEAARVGWHTNPASRLNVWDDVPEANKAAMRAGVTALLERLGIFAFSNVASTSQNNDSYSESEQ